MKRFSLMQCIFALLLACVLAGEAAQIAVPTPRPFTDKLPPGLIAQFRNAVVKGVQQIQINVLPEDASNRLWQQMAELDEAGQAGVLRSNQVDGVLLVRIERSIDGFVLVVEPHGCSSAMAFPTHSFSIPVGEFQNLPNCVPELISHLRSETTDDAAPVMVLLMPRIKDPGAPLFLKNSLSSFLESTLMTDGYRVCAGRAVEDAQRVNKLGGFFELTPERCQKLGNSLLVKEGSIIEITLDTYELQTVKDERGGRVFQIALKGCLREFSTSSGKMVFEREFALNQLRANDPCAASLTPALRNNASAFSQFALEYVLREQVLAVWPSPRK